MKFHFQVTVQLFGASFEVCFSLSPRTRGICVRLGFAWSGFSISRGFMHRGWPFMQGGKRRRGRLPKKPKLYAGAGRDLDDQRAEGGPRSSTKNCDRSRVQDGASGMHEDRFTCMEEGGASVG